MYRREKYRSAALWICGILAVGTCLALIVFFVWTLALRTDYRAVCLEINDAVLSSSSESNTIQCGGETYPASDPCIDFYNRYLLGSGTTVFNRKKHDPADRTITIGLTGGTLRFTGLEDGTAVAVEWSTSEAERHFTVRNSYETFSQLYSYYVNYRNRMDLPAAS